MDRSNDDGGPLWDTKLVAAAEGEAGTVLLPFRDVTDVAAVEDLLIDGPEPVDDPVSRFD